jgi:hypothetical protein
MNSIDIWLDELNKDNFNSTLHYLKINIIRAIDKMKLAKAAPYHMEASIWFVLQNQHINNKVININKITQNITNKFYYLIN